MKINVNYLSSNTHRAYNQPPAQREYVVGCSGLKLVTSTYFRL